MSTIKLPVFTIILSAQPVFNTDPAIISKIMNSFNSISEWSHDLEDSDKILRIVSSANISTELVLKLAESGIKSSVMEVFDKEPEIKYNFNSEWALLLERLY